MRRIYTSITAAALALSMTLGLAGTAQAAPAGYDSAYQFESAFLSLKPGDSGTFSAFFANTGTTSWVKGSGSQVNLAVCAADKVTCNVTSAQAAWAVNWLSATAYATHTKDTVVPGDFSAFTFNVKVPAGTTGGTYRFNGDLVQGSSGTRVHPEGYYQDAAVTAAGTGGTSITITPAYSSSNNQDREVSTAVPGNGQTTYTAQVNGLTGTVNISVSGTTVNSLSDGNYSFLDDNGDKKADSLCTASSYITALNGVAITKSACVSNYAIPADGKITITIDSDTRNQRVRVIVWQDKLNNGQVDLANAGSKPNTTAARVYGVYDVANDGLIAVSGRTYFLGPQGTFGQQFIGNSVTCNTGVTPASTTALNSAPVFRHDSTNKTFSAGTSGSASLRFTYDATDIFRINGVQVTMAQFQSSLDADSTGIGDDMAINYSPDPAGISEFNITCNHGADSPSDLAASLGNFDNGTAAEDVSLTFTVPDYGTISSYMIQRSDGGPTSPSGTSCSATDVPSNNYATIGTVSPAGTQGQFTDFDRPGSSTTNRTFCYRVHTQDPTTAGEFSSNVVTVTVGSGAADVTKPLSTGANLTSSSGFANTLDTGDKLEITFNEPMSLAPNAVIRFTDSDCGAATNTGPAACSGAQTNTVGDVICGTNATCILDNFGASTSNRLVVTMTGNPTIVSAGSTAGLQYPIVVTDSSGVTDTSGNAWDFPNAAGDRLIP